MLALAPEYAGVGVYFGLSRQPVTEAPAAITSRVVETANVLTTRPMQRLLVEPAIGLVGGPLIGYHVRVRHCKLDGCRGARRGTRMRGSFLARWESGEGREG